MNTATPTSTARVPAHAVGPTDPDICGILMTEQPGDLSVGLGGGRYCLRPKAPGQDMCRVHLGHQKRRVTNAKNRAARYRSPGTCEPRDSRGTVHGAVPRAADRPPRPRDTDGQHPHCQPGVILAAVGDPQHTGQR